MQDRMRRKGRYILSFGCGVNTAALMVLLVKNKMPFDEAVFADTGGELPETYGYLKLAESFLVANDKILTVVQSKTGSLFETCFRRRVTPSKMWRWSTRDYKITPIHAYYRSLGQHIYEYLGIAYDEIERMKESNEPYITSLFPLIDQQVTRDGCIEIIQNAGLPVPVKSGCFFCPFNNIDRWKEIYQTHPELYTKAMRLEENSKYFPGRALFPGTLDMLMKRGFRPNGNGHHHDDQPCGAYCMT
jgi:hypothetical protein